jgi:hypothetical protein
MSRTLVAGIHGGLGNQLFCFANAYCLARRNNAVLVLDTQSAYHAGNKYQAECMLSHFNIKWQEANRLQRFIRSRARKHKDIRILLTLKRNSYVFLAEKKNLSKYTDYNDIVESSFSEYNNIYVNGLWQCEKYFYEFRDEILQVLQIVTPLSDKNREILDKIRSTNAIAIHARNTPDLPHNPGHDCYRREIRLESYYQDAIKRVLEQVAEPFFYCFSDYHVWPEFIKKLPNVNIVNWNNMLPNGAIQDFSLMSQCKHFIMGPSTFSWWAAWLGETKESVICAPSNYKYKYSNNRSIIPDRWLSLD